MFKDKEPIKNVTKMRNIMDVNLNKTLFFSNIDYNLEIFLRILILIN
jgi:hypothetical protein